MPFRFTQGTSTRPATGSQTNPNTFFIHNVIAVMISSVVPPIMATAQAAAIAAAVPTSA